MKKKNQLIKILNISKIHFKFKYYNYFYNYNYFYHYNYLFWTLFKFDKLINNLTQQSLLHLKNLIVYLEKKLLLNNLLKLLIFKNLTNHYNLIQKFTLLTVYKK